MSKSTRLSSAAYILSFVASRAPEQVTSDTISNAVQDHPTRVRQLISTLVKAGLVKSTRGASGGVALAKPASEISLREVYEAVEENAMISMPQKGMYRGWGADCLVHSKLSALYSDAEARLRAELAQVSIADLYTPRENQ